MRVGIIGFLHESNTFIDSPTTVKHFHADAFCIGEDVRERFAEAPHEIGGFFQGLAEEGIEPVPLFAARATPSGPINFNMLFALRARFAADPMLAGRLDGILAAMHGSAVGEDLDDVDGSLLSELDEPGVPLIATLDLHANLSKQMVEAADALIGYRTNPHIDQRERGIEAAKLMARTLRGEVKPTMAAAFPRVAINIEKQLTSEQPCKQLFGLADEQLHEPMVLSNSVLLGFPYADVEEMGSSVIVVTDNEPEIAQQLANNLACHIESNRHLFAGEFLDVTSAVEQALTLDGPVLLLDMGDNIGGGAPGDGTEIACEITKVARRLNRPINTFVCLVDPNVPPVEELSLIDSRPWRLSHESEDPPVYAFTKLFSEHDGKFSEDEVTHGGITEFDQGRTTVMKTDEGLTIMFTANRVPPFSLKQMTAFGLNPADFQIIIAKGVHAPRAAYGSVCKHFLRVDTSGVTRADMTKLTYFNRRRPMFPFEELDDL